MTTRQAALIIELQRDLDAEKAKVATLTEQVEDFERQLQGQRQLNDALKSSNYREQVTVELHKISRLVLDGIVELRTHGTGKKLS